MPLNRDALVKALRKGLSLSKSRRFRQSVELVVVLRGVDMKSPEARIREAVSLPKGLGKSLKVCIVAEGDMLLEARKLEVEVYSREELQSLGRKDVKKIAERCDWVLVRADLMGVAGKILGPALGPRGKAPIPVPPNTNIREFVERYNKTVWVRIRNQPQISCRIGSEDMSVDDIAENALAVLSVVESRLGAQRIGEVYVKKTMSPPVEVKMR